MSIAPYDEADPSRLCSRADRFKQHLSVDIDDLIRESSSPLSRVASPSHKRVRGTCKNIEKDYFRLTSAPPAASVRPLEVLKQALVNVKKRYIDNDDYEYASNQLKAIRQDLTVQSINSRFTVHVYETHARIALIAGDLSEYNQCQSRLQEIRNKYNISISGDEFDCYKILHALFRGNNLELIGTLRQLASEQASAGKEVAFALEVIKSVRSSNSHRFFRLYKSSPQYSGFLMDYLVNGRRKSYLSILLRAQPCVAVDFIQQQLHFASEKDCYNFLYDNKAKVVRADEGGGYSVDCRATLHQQAGSGAALAPAPAAAEKALPTTGFKRVLHSSGRGDIVSEQRSAHKKKKLKAEHKKSQKSHKKSPGGNGGIDDIFDRLNGSLK